MKTLITLSLLFICASNVFSQNEVNSAVEKFSISKKKFSLNEGLNKVSTFPSSKYQVAIKATVGESPEWVILTPSGTEVPSQMYQQATKCWRCFEDVDGRLHCVEVPCPVDTKPWDGKRKKRRI